MDYIVIYAPQNASHYKSKNQIRRGLAECIQSGGGDKSSVIFIGDTKTDFFEELFGICSALCIPIANISTESNLSAFMSRLEAEPASQIYLACFMLSDFSDYSITDMKLYTYTMILDGFHSEVMERNGLQEKIMGFKTSMDDASEDKVNETEAKILDTVEKSQMFAPFAVSRDFGKQLSKYLEKRETAKCT